MIEEIFEIGVLKVSTLARSYYFLTIINYFTMVEENFENTNKTNLITRYINFLTN